MSNDEQKPDAVPEKTEAPQAASALPVTSPSPEPPDLWKKTKQAIYERYGLPGLVVLLVGTAWWNWDTIRTLPGVAQTLDRLATDSLPQADPECFTVALAHLENDDDRRYENLILAGLNEQFDSQEKNAVQILRFDRTIERRGADLEVSVNDAHQQARAYLEESGADVLIWGSVLKDGDESIPKLYWTPSSGVDRARDWGRYPTQDLELPAVFWTDLVEVLQLLVVTRDTEFRSLKGQFVADRLRPFVEKVRALLTSRGEGWSEETRARVRLVLADSLTTLGDQEGTNEALEEAIVLYRETLEHYTRERVPLDWARTQNNLGNALAVLGERESGPERLERAVAAYRKALKERKRERVPLHWAATQNNLGNALAILGERESGTERLDQAAAAYSEALKEYTREHVPLQWATTQNNLGNALRSLGERESGTARLEQAVAAYREALMEWTRERVPLDWARTQNNLGNALQRLGERGSGTARLEQAVASYHEALQEWTRERVPLDWAMTQNNLGAALQTLGERESGTARLEQAVAAYREALMEWTRERVPLDWATTQNNLGNALASLGERESGTTRLEQAVAAYREALQEWTRERVPLDWAMTQNNLGAALQTLGERESGTERLEQAVAAYQEALQEWTRERVPLHWARTQHNLGIALRGLGEREREVALVCEGLGSHLASWALFTDADATHYSSGAEQGVTNDLQSLRDHFAPADYEPCLDKHRKLLDSFRSSRAQ